MSKAHCDMEEEMKCSICNEQAVASITEKLDADTVTTEYFCKKCYDGFLERWSC